ncbi:unnamed protein product [Phytophthora fragariaefolia]|uniref:Unnamed protein product n=1 Tax=Phytophthora fragariaefolia TaxID=1490495 RepID=A0A9W7CS92_9STRA|nr:unnamed protein product [Phytophthora fragariaefolia]
MRFTLKKYFNANPLQSAVGSCITEVIVFKIHYRCLNNTPLHGVILKVNTQNQNVNAQIQNSSEMLYLFQYAFIRLILVGANSMAGTL